MPGPRRGEIDAEVAPFAIGQPQADQEAGAAGLPTGEDFPGPEALWTLVQEFQAQHACDGLRHRWLVRPRCRGVVQLDRQTGWQFQTGKDLLSSVGRRQYQSPPGGEGAGRNLPCLHEALQVHAVEGMDGQPGGLNQRERDEQHERGTPGETLRPEATEASDDAVQSVSTVVAST